MPRDGLFQTESDAGQRQSLKRGNNKVQIGAILTLAGEEIADHSSPTNGNGMTHIPLPDPLTPILGKTLVERTLERLVKAGSKQPKVIVGTRGIFAPLACRNGHGQQMERAIAELISQGAGLILFTGVETYHDLDYEELIRFHLARNAAFTRVYTADEPLAVAIVSVPACDSRSEYRSQLAALAQGEERYLYDGYFNRLASAPDFRQLVEDGLNGRCRLQPTGHEVEPGVWMDEGAEVDATAVIMSPAFIGQRARVSAYASVRGASAVEHHSQVDCGTSLDEAWVLEGSYVGVGLDVRRSIVYHNTLFHLDRNLEIGIADHRLLGPVAAFSAISAGRASRWNKLEHAYPVVQEGET